MLHQDRAHRTRQRGRPHHADQCLAAMRILHLMVSRRCVFPCHNLKTRGEQTGENYLLKGCDVFGNPLDPNHPWYKT